MSSQPSLLQKADDGQVLLPPNEEQVQVVRDKSIFSLGKFWAYFKDGTKELIGGPGASGLTTSDIYPAFAGGGQTNATPLIAYKCLIIDVPNEGDSVKLAPLTYDPISKVGSSQIVQNRADSDNAIDIFPTEGDDLGNGVDMPFSLASGNDFVVNCYLPGIGVH